MACCTGVAADELYSHFKRDLKELAIKASHRYFRLLLDGVVFTSSILIHPHRYCNSVIEEYGLLPRAGLKSPSSIIQAIDGLPVESNMFHCGRCGYAARTAATLRRHFQGQEKCKDSEILRGHGQTFFPTSNRGFFAVRIPQAKPDSLNAPVPLSALFRAQFSLRSAGDSTITVPPCTRDMNHFLTLGNWVQQVEGLKGKEARHITRTSLPSFRALVEVSVKSYVKGMNTKLWAEDPPVKTAMGDYNR